MSTQGLITNQGIDESIKAQNNEGFKLTVTGFAVSEIVGDFLQSRDINSINTVWYSGLISSVVRIDNNVLQFNCNIPAETVLDPKFVREVYLFSEDELNNQYLLAFGQPSNELVYDPEGELRIRMQIKLDNINIADLYEFKYTQATEIEDHNNDPNAHPFILNNINKAGIYTTALENRFNGQNYDGFPTISPNVNNRNVVYFDSINNRYDNALVDIGNPSTFALGFYDAVRNIVISNGIFDFPHGFQPYTDIYLSTGFAGTVTTAPTRVKVGYTLPNNRIFVSISIQESAAEANPDGDFFINIIPPIIRELTLEDSNGIAWDVTVGDDGLLTTTPNSIRNPDTLFRIPKIDLSFAQLIVQTDGTLTVVSPPIDNSIAVEEFYYLESPNGTAWKLTVDLSNILTTVSFQNIFLVRSENTNHFAVKQTSITHALTYIQIYDPTTLPLSPPLVNGLLPLCFYNDSGNIAPIYWDGSQWLDVSGSAIGGPSSPSVFIVGDVNDVNNGLATFSSIQSAINAAPSGAKVKLLARTFTENVNVTKKLFIEGEGHDSVINGNVNLDVAAARSLVKYLKFSENVIGAVGCNNLIITDCWLAATKTINLDIPSENLVLVMQEN
jgi:hypothetical protein